MSFSFGGGGASTGSGGFSFGGAKPPAPATTAPAAGTLGGFGFGGAPAMAAPPAGGTPAPAFGGFGAPVRGDLCVSRALSSNNGSFPGRRPTTSSYLGLWGSGSDRRIWFWWRSRNRSQGPGYRCTCYRVSGGIWIWWREHSPDHSSQ